MTTGTWVAEIPRTLWLLAAVLVGLLHGSIRDWAATRDPLDDFDVLLTDQRQFESALVAERHGHRLFKDITVYPHWLGDRSMSSRRLVHLVTGAYWDGRTNVRDGAVQARWVPAVFVAPVPYQLVDGSAGTVPAGTVLDYLGQLRQTRGVEFRYAWWWWARRPVFTSTLVSVGLIGGVAPAALNLLVFGMLTRPRAERRPSLWRVRRRRSQGAAAPVVAASRPSAEEPSAPPAGLPEPVLARAAPLATADPVPVPAASEPEHHYGAKEDDFYPTELRVAPPHHSKPAC